jgi:membrane protein implicated in regulation of membrane protease activity
MNRKKTCIIDLLLALDFILLAYSGFAAHFADGIAWPITHTLSSVVFIVLTILHVLDHRKMIQALAKKNNQPS